MYDLTKEETATILAALRHWQREIEFNTEKKLVHVVPLQYAEHFVDVEPLDVDEIDNLCETINALDKSDAAYAVAEQLGLTGFDEDVGKSAAENLEEAIISREASRLAECDTGVYPTV